MLGYHQNPAATAAALDGQGWLHTGDLGSLDEEGYLSISGRLKEVIRKEGKAIFPAEIEELLFAHPKVHTAQVFGIPHPALGEEVAAWIKLKPGYEAATEEILDFLKDKLPDSHLPRHVKFVKEFPMTPLGKIQKFKMREIFSQELKAQGLAL
jgi:fatty-acyl-CoA synthase